MGGVVVVGQGPLVGWLLTLTPIGGSSSSSNSGGGGSVLHVRSLHKHTAVM